MVHPDPLAPLLLKRRRERTFRKPRIGLQPIAKRIDVVIINRILREKIL